MARKKSWVMYESWIPLFESLPNDKAGVLIKAICAYKKGDEDSEWTLDPVLTSVFLMIKETLDSDATKYAEVCKTRSESASKAYVSKRKHTEANASKCKQKDASRVESDSESDSESVFDSDNESPSETKRVRFVPPTVEEVRAYCIERNNNVDAESFVNFYASKGWMVGKNKMKDWKACVRTWERNRKDTPTSTTSNAKIHNFQERKYDYAALERMLVEN